MKYIGNEYIRVDGVDKLTGRSKYVDDYMTPDMVYAAIVRSSIPYGRILSIKKTMHVFLGLLEYIQQKIFQGTTATDFLFVITRYFQRV